MQTILKLNLYHPSKLLISHLISNSEMGHHHEPSILLPLLLMITLSLMSGKEVVASRHLLETAVLPAIPELPKVELPSLPTVLPTLPKFESPPLPKAELPPLPDHLPTLQQPELPTLPKPEFSAIPHVPALELPALPHLSELPN